MAARQGEPVQKLAQGGCARLDDLRTAQSPAGNPVAVASVIGVGCTSMSPALAQLAGSTPVLHIDPLEAYLLAPLADAAPPRLPFISLVASARFTALVQVAAPGQYRVLGRTRDISAGAVFDKLAWLLGMDVPGGSALERMADFGDATSCDLPEPGPDIAPLDFSFAPLQTAALDRARELEGGPCEQPRADLAASVQAAVVRQLAARTRAALSEAGVTRLVLAGGVARNTALRLALQAAGIAPHPTATLPRSHRVATAALLRQLYPGGRAAAPG